MAEEAKWANSAPELFFEKIKVVACNHLYRVGMPTFNIPRDDELIGWLAKMNWIPVKSGNSIGVDYTLRKMGDCETPGRRTNQSIINRLEISCDSECKKVREDIKSHPNW